MYAAISDLQNRYDQRLIAQASSDDNSGSLASAVINAALADASYEFNAAVLQGSIYNISDVTTLLSTGDTIVTRVVCDIAMRNLFARRGRGTPDFIQKNIERSDKFVEALRSGKRVLNVSKNRAADAISQITLPFSGYANITPLASLPILGGAAGTLTINNPGGAGAVGADSGYGGYGNNPFNNF